MRPGDLVLYSGAGLWSWVIKVKTWSPVSHCEVVIGGGQTVTAREGRGVNVYAFTDAHLYAVLRPEWAPNLEAALRWFRGVQGQPYGYWQALRFFRLGKEDQTRMMCSPCCARFYRAGGFHAFAGDFDASLVSPGMFLSSPHFVPVWRADRVGASGSAGTDPPPPVGRSGALAPPREETHGNA